jgi:hypothetical protein
LQRLAVCFRVDVIVDRRRRQVEQKHGRKEHKGPFPVDLLVLVEKKGQCHEKRKQACDFGLYLNIA